MSADKTKSIFEELVFSIPQQWIKGVGPCEKYVVVKCWLEEREKIFKVSVSMPPCDAKGPLRNRIPRLAVIGDTWQLADRLCSVEGWNLVILSPEKDVALWAPWDGHRLIYPRVFANGGHLVVAELTPREVEHVLRKFAVYKKGFELCSKCCSSHQYIEFYTGDGWQKITNCV